MRILKVSACRPFEVRRGKTHCAAWPQCGVAVPEHVSRHFKGEVLDDVIRVDPVNASRWHGPRLGQVKVHVGSPEDVGVDPTGEDDLPGTDIHLYWPRCRGDRLLKPSG